jgi:hypothetical protein
MELYMINIKFHLPNSNRSLVIAIKPKAKHRVYRAAILLPHIKKNNFKVLLPYIILGLFHYAAVVSLPHKFVQLPCWYY